MSSFRPLGCDRKIPEIEGKLHSSSPYNVEAVYVIFMTFYQPFSLHRTRIVEVAEQNCCTMMNTYGTWCNKLEGGNPMSMKWPVTGEENLWPSIHRSCLITSRNLHHLMIAEKKVQSRNSTIDSNFIYFRVRFLSSHWNLLRSISAARWRPCNLFCFCWSKERLLHWPNEVETVVKHMRLFKSESIFTVKLFRRVLKCEPSGEFSVVSLMNKAWIIHGKLEISRSFCKTVHRWSSKSQFTYWCFGWPSPVFKMKQPAFFPSPFSVLSKLHMSYSRSLGLSNFPPLTNNFISPCLEFDSLTKLSLKRD